MFFGYACKLQRGEILIASKYLSVFKAFIFGHIGYIGKASTDGTPRTEIFRNQHRFYPRKSAKSLFYFSISIKNNLLR